jgi:hypothetical protein
VVDTRRLPNTRTAHRKHPPASYSPNRPKGPHRICCTDLAAPSQWGPIRSSSVVGDYRLRQ